VIVITIVFLHSNCVVRDARVDLLLPIKKQQFFLGFLLLLENHAAISFAVVFLSSFGVNFVPSKSNSFSRGFCQRFGTTNKQVFIQIRE